METSFLPTSETPLFGDVRKCKTHTENHEHKSPQDSRVEPCMPQNTW